MLHFCRISTDCFKKLSELIVELFPTEDKELFYIPFRRSVDGLSISARGSLYNHYKVVRKNLRTAGYLEETLSKNNSFTESGGINEIKRNFLLLFIHYYFNVISYSLFFIEEQDDVLRLLNPVEESHSSADIVKESRGFLTLKII